MNANELADKLDFGKYDWADLAATMLRQQQAEIEALKNRNWDLVSEPWGFDRHPVKELTDDELFKVYADLQEGYTGNNFPVDLGRAILRKAQEK